MADIKKVNDLAGSLHIDSYLTTYSEAWQQDSTNFVAAACSTRIPVQKESAKYVVYPRGYFWRDEVEVRPLGGRPKQAGYTVDNGTYLAEEWALEHSIDDRQRANADQPINLDRNATRLLTGKQMIRADRIWAQNFFTTGKWSLEYAGGAAGGTGAFTHFDDATSMPISIIDGYRETLMQATGYMPNVLVLGSSVFMKLKNNPDVVDRIKYTQTGILTEQLLAMLLGVDRVVVARSVYNSAAEGDTDAVTFIADPKAMLLAYIEPNPDLDSPTAIANFAWTGLMPGDTNDFGGVIERMRDERAHSDIFQSRQAFDLRQVSADMGMFFTGVVS